ncbi:MAG: riboflavin synthase [Micrococcus sp.]|nr:riboflavin synthase [Micrococcus sp.]
MFTGIITHVGVVEALELHPEADAATLTLDTRGAATDLPEGGSLAVNGVCLTALPTQADAPQRFRADLMGQTLRMTTLGSLRPGDRVNLERCLRPIDHLDGHVVQGHVDGIGVVEQVRDEGAWRSLRIGVGPELARYLPAQGAVAVQGVSLTITDVSAPDADTHHVGIGLIPATLEATTLGSLREGSRVNIETDVLARYAERLAQIPALAPTGERS